MTIFFPIRIREAQMVTSGITPRWGSAALMLALIVMPIVCMAGSASKDTTHTTAPATTPTFSGRVIEMPRKLLASGRDTITLAIEVPRGYHLTDEAPSSLCWYSDNVQVVDFPRSCKSYKTGSIRFPFKLALNARAGQSNLTLDANVFYCEDKTKLCMFDKFRIKVPVEVTGRGAKSTTLSVELEVLDEQTP